MALEKEIQQTNFVNSYQKLLLSIMVTNNNIVYKLTELFASYGITMQQYNILRILRGAKESISTAQLKMRMLDKNSDTSRIVDRMVLKEIVEKQVNATDKRLVIITITEKGLSLLEKIDKVEYKFFELVNNITEDEAEQVNNLLQRIRAKHNNS